jgi:broad specificity phosphatase PhoE
MGKILLVRHGQASLLSADYDQLSPLGAEQARLLGRWWAARGDAVHQVWSGSLKRQRDTALACFSEWPTPAPSLQIDDGFNEYSHHDVFASQGKDIADPAVLAETLKRSDNPRRLFQQLFSKAFDQWVRGQHAAPGALTWAGFRGRCMAALRRVAADCGSGQTAVVVSSGGAIAAMCQELMGVPDTHVAELHYAVHNTSVTRLLCQGERITLSAFNALPHLEAPGVAPHLITYR